MKEEESDARTRSEHGYRESGGGLEAQASRRIAGQSTAGIEPMSIAESIHCTREH